MSEVDLNLKQRSAILNIMIDELEELGYPMATSRSCLNAGEDGISFRFIFFMAKKSESYSEKWATEIRAFNEFFSLDKYMRRCGYPLS